MRRAAATALAMAFAAMPADAAETVARRPLTAGPVLAAGRVVWGSATGSGAPTVFARRPGAPVRELARIPRSTSQVFRGVTEVAASGRRAAAIVEICARIRGDESRAHAAQPFGVRCARRALTGTVTGRLAPLGSRLPRRLPSFAACRHLAGPVDVALDGATTAIAYGPTCDITPAARVTPWVAAGGRRLAARGRITDLRVAGRYVAWTQRVRDTTELVLYDLRTGRRLHRLRPAAGDIMAFDLTRAGAMAIARTRPARTPAQDCISWLGARARAARMLACDANPNTFSIAAWGRRVLYPGGTGSASTVLLRSGTASPRQLAAVAGLDQLTYELDLDAHRAVWATFRTTDDSPGERSSLHLQRLG